MRRIQLDEEDSHLITKRTWYLHSTGYMRCNAKVDGKHITYHLHHEILPKKEGYDVDHINRDTLDNRRSNLRYVTKSQNQMNRGPQKNNTTGYKGVGLDKRTGKYTAKITHMKERIWIGTFDTAEEAGEAYCRQAVELQGDYAYEI